jgi:hypothetical protein
VFTIGSITKQFTGAAIVKLEMEGKLSVSDSITKYFKNVPLDKSDITIHHLLTHTAGLVDGLGGDHDLRATGKWILDEAMKSELLAPPGKRHRYSNLGYSLLGLIVEKVSGQGYEQYLHDHLFVPAGMNRTGYLIPNFKPEALAVGYREGERWGTVLGRPMLEGGPCWNLRANGGIHSTIDDMYKWHVALEGEKILSAEAKEKYFAPHVSEGFGDSFYGYGWVNFKTPRGTRLLAHNGGNMIFSADFRRYVDENVVLFQATNISEYNPDRLSNSIAGIVFGLPFAMPPELAPLDATALSRLTGNYRLSGGATVQVKASNAGLAIIPNGQEALSAFASSGRTNGRQLESLNKYTTKIVQKSADGDFAPIHKAFGRQMSLEEISSEETNGWAERRSRLGQFKTVTALGSAPHHGRMVATTVRLDFDKGADYVKFVWEGRQLVGIRGVPGPPAFNFKPTSALEFVAYKLGSDEHPTVRFEMDSQGKPTKLIAKTGAGEVVATLVR